jgi:hypothetical protein
VEVTKKFPLEERPQYLKAYLHKKLADQANRSLNNSNVEKYMHRELSKQRIAALRNHHS